VSQDQRQFVWSKITVNDMQIGPAHAASINLDQNLVLSWSRYGDSRLFQDFARRDQ